MLLVQSFLARVWCSLDRVQVGRITDHNLRRVAMPNLHVNLERSKIPPVVWTITKLFTSRLEVALVSIIDPLCSP